MRVDAELLLAWRAVYEELVHRATHEVNNALNGAALEAQTPAAHAGAGA